MSDLNRRKHMSVVMVTFNRAHLLERSLHCYLHQDLGNDLVEYIVIDDDSTDHTMEVCHQWARDLDLKYVRLRKPEGVAWRDSAALINTGIRMSRGEIIVPTHPEIMVGRATLRKMAEAIEDRMYVSAKPYFLDIEDQEQLDSVDWKGEGPLAVRRLPGFYGKPRSPSGTPEHRQERIEEARVWDSWQVGGMTAGTWGWIGGLTEFDSWGSVDLDFLKRRNILGIKTHTLTDEDCLCIHQNHDAPGDVQTHRDFERASADLPEYHTPQDAIRDNLWKKRYSPR